MDKKIENKAISEKLRKNLKELIQQMDITQKEASDLIAEFLGEENFYECFKSDLKRCTKPHKLEHYIFALKSSEKYQKIQNIRARFEGDKDILGEELQEELHKLSKLIADQIDENIIDDPNN